MDKLEELKTELIKAQGNSIVSRSKLEYAQKQMIRILEEEIDWRKQLDGLKSKLINELCEPRYDKDKVMNLQDAIFIVEEQIREDYS